MILNAIYLSFFGLLFFTSTFLCVVWGRVAVRRSMKFKPFYPVVPFLKRLYHDRYMVLSTALAINALGTSFLFCSRLISSFLYGMAASLVPGTLGYMIAFGMGVILTAKYGFMWAVELDKGNVWWRVFVVMSVIWVLFVLCYELWLGPTPLLRPVTILVPDLQ